MTALLVMICKFVWVFELKSDDTALFWDVLCIEVVRWNAMLVSITG